MTFLGDAMILLFYGTIFVFPGLRTWFFISCCHVFSAQVTLILKELLQMLRPLRV